MKSSTEIKKQVIEAILEENIKHEMMIKHLTAEAELEMNGEKKAKILLQAEQTKDKILANNRFIKNNE